MVAVSVVVAMYARQFVGVGISDWIMFMVPCLAGKVSVMPRSRWAEVRVGRGGAAVRWFS